MHSSNFAWSLALARETFSRRGEPCARTSQPSSGSRHRGPEGPDLYRPTRIAAGLDLQATQERGRVERRGSKFDDLRSARAARCATRSAEMAASKGTTLVMLMA